MIVTSHFCSYCHEGYLTNLCLIFYFILFIYFWLHWVFIAARGLSLVASNGGYSLLRCAGFSLQWLLLLQSMGCRLTGFSCCSTQAQKLWYMGLVVPRHVGSSWTMELTCVPCIGRQILNHCDTRGVPKSFSWRGRRKKWANWVLVFFCLINITLGKHLNKDGKE